MTDNTQVKDFFDKMDERADKERQSNGFFCKFAVRFGFGTYISGLEKTDTVFFYSTDEEYDVAKKKAKQLFEDNGVALTKLRSQCFLIMYNDTVVRGMDDKVWANDWWSSIFMWTPAYKDLLKPSFKQAGVPSDGEYWGHIKFAPDPSGYKKKKKLLDENGEPILDANGEQTFEEVANMIPYVSKVFASEQECRAEAEKVLGLAESVVAEATNLEEEVPPGFTAATWGIIKRDISTQLKSGLTKEDVARKFAIDVKFLKNL